MIEDVSTMDLSGFIIAEVMDNVDPDMEGKIAVYIPQLMYEYEYDETPYDSVNPVALNSELILNSDDFQDSVLEVQSSNYIWARPLNFYEDNVPNWKYGDKYYYSGSIRIPRVGSQVVVIFFGQDLQKCYYLPFSPTYAGDKIDSINCCKEENFNDATLRPNVDVIRVYWDGMRIEADTNSHEIKLSSPEGNYIKISDKDIEIKGKVHLLDELEVDKETKLKGQVNIEDLVTCKNKLVVQDVAYFYTGQIVTGNITNNGDVLRNCIFH